MLERMDTVLHLKVFDVVVAAVVVLVLLSVTAVLAARRGRRGLRQRLQALASRLGADTPPKEPKDLEDVLIYVEHATDRAAEAVAEASCRGDPAASGARHPCTRPSSSPTSGARRCSATARAVALMGSRHGDALAAQAVDELLAETAPGATRSAPSSCTGPPGARSSCAPRASTTASARSA
jgi:hypothetical protein